MAWSRQTTSSYTRTNPRSAYGQTYIYGNTVRKAEALPQHPPQRKSVEPKRTSRQVRKNRNRAMNINKAYASFLIVAAISTIFICVGYLKLQSEMVNRSEHVSELQAELANLTEKNDTAYHAIVDSIDLEEVRQKAIDELGMVYAAQGNVVTYENPESGTLKQYEEIPTDEIWKK
jgi:predicted transcriptional regulator